MHSASGWDWFLGFSYVSLSYVRELDYLIASVLFPGFGVGLQGVRTAGVWGSALHDDAGYEQAVIQTALLSLAAFGLYVAKLPPASVGGGGSLMTPAGPLAYATSTVNTDALGRGLVIASELAHVLFAKNYSPHTAESLFGRTGRTRTNPTGPLGGKPDGLPDRNPHGDYDNLRGLEIEEHSADLLAARGYRVKQQPGKLANGKDPDFWIEDTIFDNYAPKASNTTSIWDGVNEKIVQGQTRRVVLNLERSDAVVDDVITVFKDYPIDDLDEIILITKDQTIIHIYP